MSKIDQLLRLLKSGGSYSKKDIWRAIKLWNSGGAINVLRNRGYNIITTTVNRNDEEFGEYSLEAKS